MRAGAAGFPVADLIGLGRLADIENKKPFRRWLPVSAAPARRDAFEAGDHFTVGDLDLNGPGIFRPGNVSAILRRRRIGDIEYAPAAMPKVGDVEIPAAIFLLQRQLEGRLAVQIMVADGVNIFREVAFGNRLRHGYRLTPTPNCGQYFFTGQSLHIGEIGRQRCWPKFTSKLLYSIQYCFGSLTRRADSVFSGVAVWI